MPEFGYAISSEEHPPYGRYCPMWVDRIRARRVSVLGGMLRLLTYVTVALALPLALLACGEEDEEATGQVVEISASEFAFDPSTISLDAAGTYTFRLTNDGEFEHALEIEGQGIEEETDVIGGGETAELTVDLAEGEYVIYCPVGNHREMGMEGTLVVGGTAGGAGTGTVEDETTTEEETTTQDTDTGRY
jgi:plastocyanin